MGGGDGLDIIMMVEDIDVDVDQSSIDQHLSPPSSLSTTINFQTSKNNELL